LEKIRIAASTTCRIVDPLNRQAIIQPRIVNKMGMQAAMYCNNGMECSEETKIMQIAEITRRETDRPKFLKGLKNIKGTKISGKI
tara:strand:+ start:45 stop:299 length:255 start_codon:yes stop_codon:yes gene_type:complete